MSEPVIVQWHPQTVTRKRGCVVWFTGFSGSGKSTIANCVDYKLHQMGVRSFLLDGDNVRHGLNASPALLKAQHGDDFANRFGLGFGAQDREENIRRISAVAEILCSAGIITLTAFVSPYQRDRQLARRHVEAHGQPGDFVEVFVDTPLSVCEQRDPKGLYRKARAGELKGFTGIDDPYEVPDQPELRLATDQLSIEQAADQVIAYLLQSEKVLSKD
jgi:adenylylsulfate kinase